jgi:hypothetical protein
MLPPYFPELDPAERWFEEFRRKLSNRTFENVALLQEALTQTLRPYWEDPALLKRLRNCPKSPDRLRTGPQKPTKTSPRSLISLLEADKKGSSRHSSPFSDSFSLVTLGGWRRWRRYDINSPERYQKKLTTPYQVPLLDTSQATAASFSSASRSLRTICSGVCLFFVRVLLFLPVSGFWTLYSNRISFWVAGHRNLAPLLTHLNSLVMLADGDGEFHVAVGRIRRKRSCCSVLV